MFLGLSEEISIKQFIIAHYEKYSSTVATFQIMGSQIYPTEGWRDLGTFRVSERGGEQRFEVGERGEHFRRMLWELDGVLIDGVCVCVFSSSQF